MRYTMSLLSALIISGLLFIAMNLLISRGQWNISDAQSYSIVDFVRIKPEERVDARKRTLPKKKPVPQQEVHKTQVRTSKVSKREIQMSNLSMETPAIDGIKLQSGLFLGGFSKETTASLPDGDAQPLLRIAPQYPRRAAVKGVEGWVKIAFTIQGDGSVLDAKVIDAKPSRIFNRAALNAIKKWKFKPRLVEGKPVPRKAEQIIEFTLSK